MTELTVKDLKAILDENSLDLSLRQISILPTKALRLVPRATEIDFSNNLVSMIEPEFCSLVHLTKLDLNSNSIQQLPHNFGDLINLVHLDLYRNQITDLPLSFGNLKALKWLDLKGNPLVPDLAKIADDCLDKKGCTQAALRVVRLMSVRAERLEEQEIVKTRVASEIPNNDQNVQKEKAKKKKKKHKELPNSQPVMVNSEFIDDEQQAFIEECNTDEKFQTAVSANQAGHLFGSWIVKTLFTFSMIFLGLLVAFSVGNCYFESFEGPLQATKPFCTDLHNAVHHHSLSSNIFNNLLTSLQSVLEIFIEKLSHFGHRISDSAQILALKRILSPLTNKLTSISLLAHGHIMHSMEDMQRFYNTYAADSVDSALKEAWLILRVIALMLADLIMFIVEKGVLFISSAVENLVDFAHHSDTFMRFLRN